MYRWAKGANESAQSSAFSILFPGDDDHDDDLYGDSDNGLDVFSCPEQLNR